MSIFYNILWLLPKNIMSRWFGAFMSMHMPKRLASLFKSLFVRMYKIDMSEAELDISLYASPQEIFVRKLKPSSRPICMDQDILVSPCDGLVREMGIIEEGMLIQAKDKYISIAEMLKSYEFAEAFINGFFFTLYLAPKNYHRFHMPLDANIIKTIHIPGQLWPVNNWAINNISNLFCINERIVTLMKHESLGFLAHVAIGSTNVGRIKLEYCDVVSNTRTDMQVIEHHSLKLYKGMELGCFMFGSTIILLVDKKSMVQTMASAKETIKFGEPLARLLKKHA